MAGSSTGGIPGSGSLTFAATAGGDTADDDPDPDSDEPGDDTPGVDEPEFEALDPAGSVPAGGADTVEPALEDLVEDAPDPALGVQAAAMTTNDATITAVVDELIRRRAVNAAHLRS